MPRTILVVDDSMTMRAVLELNLKKIPDVKVIQATNGHEALEKMKSESPALILTDINMPEMSGYDLIDAIRNKNNDKTTPIVFITTKGEEADRDKGLALGANAYVSKPINGLQLVETVEKLLK
jgi:two-component system, chemotaxis family, chemotaxis protein CheY